MGAHGDIRYNEQILSIVKIKNKNIDMTDDEIGLLINEVEQKIKNYCCIPQVPKQLYYTWANMVLDMIAYQTAVNTDTDLTDDDITNILSGNYGTIDEGDSSWKQGEIDGTSPYYRALMSHSPSLDDLIMNYKQDLNLFRRIW